MDDLMTKVFIEQPGYTRSVKDTYKVIVTKNNKWPSYFARLTLSDFSGVTTRPYLSSQPLLFSPGQKDW